MQQRKSGAADWPGWQFDGLDMHLYVLVVEFRESETQGEGPPPWPACPSDILVVDKVEGEVEFKALELRINKH